MRRALIHHLRRFSSATHRSSPPPLRPTPSPPHILAPKFRSFSSSDEDAPRPSPPLNLEASGDGVEGGSSALVSGEQKLAAPVEDVGNEGEIKQKIEAKFNELEDMCKKGEMEPEKAYAVFKEFEDKMVEECEQIMAVEQEKEETKLADADKKVRIDDPPGEGPVLRWQTRVVFAPGGDAYHPKNRKVKLSVTVKELGLSRHAVRRLKELVGKRYHSGKDELTITSERFEHREENRKDCLRTLYALIEEAMNADKLAQETRNAFVKSRLRANEPFMERLRAKVSSKQSPSPTSA